MTIDLTQALSSLFTVGVVLLVVTAAGIVLDAVTNMANERARREVKVGSRLQHA